MPPLIVALAAHSVALDEAKAALGSKKRRGEPIPARTSRAVTRALAATVVAARRKAGRKA